LRSALNADNAQTLVGKNCRSWLGPLSPWSPGEGFLHSLVLLAMYDPDQSGPRCRHCLANFNAVGLNAFASGTW
jgi:hypothetical protein